MPKQPRRERNPYKGKTRPSAKRRGRVGRNVRPNYRSIKTYEYFRETLPNTVTFQLIEQGTGSYAAMGYMSFENLQFNQLPGSTEFANLYARYKVDKIVTTLTPLYQDTTQVNHSAQLEITKVNTKWMNGDYPIAADATAQLTALAELQAKTKTLYASKKPITLVTKNPGVEGRSVVDSSGNEVDARTSCPWLSLSGPNAAIDVPFKHNALIFASRIDGGPIDATYIYRVTHRVFFRCSQVG